MNIKHTLAAFVCCAALAVAALPAKLNAQERGNEEPRTSPNASVSQTIGTTIVTVSYSRPGVKGRKIYGELVPYDTIWRTGANEATTITLSGNITVQGKKLPAGSYSLYTIPSEGGAWTVIFNKKIAWGIPYPEGSDVLRVEAEPQEGDSKEQLMFYFTDVTSDSAKLVMHWDTVKVPITINI